MNSTRKEHPDESWRAPGVPERAEIADFLKSADGPVKIRELARQFNLDEAAGREGLRRRLRAMERDGQLAKTRGGWGLASEMELKRGRVIGHPDGFAFITCEGLDEDVFLAPRDARGVMNGDTVLVRLNGVDRRGRPNGRVVEVLERANTQVVGRFFRDGAIGFVTPDHKRLSQDILIPKGAGKKARNGQIVVARITQQPDEHHAPIGAVEEIVGDHLAPGMEVEIAIRAYDLPHEWPDDTLVEAAKLPGEVADADKKGRLDLRDLPLVTIDGEDARDFDDAVHVRRDKDGWTLWVAIADVSRYVRPGSALDREGAWRGNSVYFPDRVIPMLPEALSNGLCSLNPDVDRLAVVCCMDIDARGERRSASFHEAVIRSHARLTYNEVAAQLAGEKLPKSSRARALADELDVMYELYKQFRTRREDRGALDIDSIEPRFVYDDERKIERVEPVIRNDAHRIIEEFMIAANFSTAEFLDASERPTVYRIHEAPDPDRAADLRTMLAGLGLTLAGGEQPEPRDFNAVLQAAHGRPDAHLIETAVMRTMKMATYATVNHGHFGLAAPAYLHFTSPIRRYPDLLVHRAIKAELDKRGAAKAAPDEELASRSAEHCSMTERRADDATRDAVNWLKCEFMLDHVGEAFAGTISSVTNFGIFVELDDIFVEGLVHVTSLPRDYYQFDPVRHTLSGDKGGMRFRLGDRVSVQVAAVSLDEKKIDFVLAESAEQSDKKDGKSGGGGRKRKRKRGGGRSRK